MNTGQHLLTLAHLPSHPNPPTATCQQSIYPKLKTIFSRLDLTPRQASRKNQLICLPQGLDIVDVVIGEKGPRSDSKLLEQTQAELPEGIPFIGDKAYVGRANTTTPIKKPPKGQLTVAQKAFNKTVSQARVDVEHLIRVIKIFRIAKEEFRMRMPMYEMVIGGVCGLVRLREQYA